MAWQLSLIGTRGTANDKHIYFPIADDATAYNSKLGELRRKGLRSDVITAFNSIQPYKGGKDDKLWVLNELSKRDKHRLLITVGSAFQSLNLGAYMSTQMSNNQFGIPIPKLNAYFRPADNLFPLKAADELFIDAVDAQPSKELDFRFNIMLNEPEVIEGAPLIDTLNGFSDIVSKTILQFGQCLT